MSAVAKQFLPTVIPYYAEKDNLPATLLPAIYQQLVKDDILADLVPEHAITENEFIRFVTTDALLHLFLDVGSSEFAGVAWLANVEEGERVKKGCVSVAFFRKWWRPRESRTFARITLGQWFNLLGFNVIYGITPATNRPAQMFAQRVGFRYVADLPGFVSRRGEVTDGRLAYLTREEFNSQPD